MTSTTDHELGLLIGVLPAELQSAVRALAPAQLLEVVMDLGRTPEARLENRAERLADAPVSRAEIDAVLRELSPVGEDNRTGIEGTLHRISVIRNRRGEVVGLTLRVGRAVVGAIELLRDLVETGQNVLLLGRPGVGKTTKLRRSRACWPTTWVGASSWSTPPTRSAATATCRTPASAPRGGCRCRGPTASTQ
ncbi:hypothetical protein [Nannocystis pusilla]|uniref:hypothetical protein n=1 Tax=Nannocystis pusilla TaxID=889268 RepID=UPI003B7E7C29